MTPMVSSSNLLKPGWVLVLHCLVYSCAFLPLLWLYGVWGTWFTITAWAALFVSHWVGDLGVPVWLWTKYIRKMTYTSLSPNDLLPEFPLRIPMRNPEDMFKENQKLTTSFYFRPILTITIDQLWHLTWLWVVVFFALHGRT